jgi:hypothetical protein
MIVLPLQFCFKHPNSQLHDKCFGAITTGKEAKRLHFIAPILVCICFLLKGDVKIVAEEDLVGNFVKAHGHFDFMLTRGTKAVCIVEAKKAKEYGKYHFGRIFPIILPYRLILSIVARIACAGTKHDLVNDIKEEKIDGFTPTSMGRRLALTLICGLLWGRSGVNIAGQCYVE